jgi:hypothetical protein
MQFVVHPVATAFVPAPTIQLATISAEPVLQLFADVQHDIAVPDVGVPVLAGVHVVPDATHEYVLVAVPDDQTEEVFFFIKLVAKVFYANLHSSFIHRESPFSKGE